MGSVKENLARLRSSNDVTLAKNYVTKQNDFTKKRTI